MFDKNQKISDFDAPLFLAMQGEQQRQEDHIELIASENYTSPMVLEAQGSVLTNKYAEGYIGNRYYGGCEWVDQVEALAIARAKTLFAADWANVQPHSGSQANAAAIMALINPGDMIMGMSLDHGGHLTHGAKVNFSGKIYQSVDYEINLETGLIDYDVLEALAQKHRPKLLIGGFSAYSRILDWARFRQIADSIGAYLLADIAHVSGLVATGLYPSPLPYADIVTTTTHKTLRGPRSGMALGRKNDWIEKKLNSSVFPGNQGGALMHVIAAKAVAFAEALAPEFKTYQMQILKNAKLMAKILMERGFKLVSGGTDNHLMLIDLVPQNITGLEATESLGRAHITINKNSIPNDKRSPKLTSGIRLGTPAITTRGFKEPEVELISHLIADVLENPSNTAVETRVRAEVTALCRRFPVYG